MALDHIRQVGIDAHDLMTMIDLWCAALGYELDHRSSSLHRAKREITASLVNKGLQPTRTETAFLPRPCTCRPRAPSR
jgi:hypothetical protein